MSPNPVTLKSTREAIGIIADNVIGRKLNIPDVLANQNITIEPVNGAPARPGRPKILSRIRQKLDSPNCHGCLMDTKGVEYVYRQGLGAFVATRTDAPFVPPSKLDECRRALGGNIPTIEMETDDGTKISLALSQGCRGGCGVISQASRPEQFFKPSGTPYFAYRSIVTPSEQDAEGARIVIQPDLGLIPVRLEAKLAIGYAKSGFNATSDFWKYAGMEEMPVRHIHLETMNVGSEASCTMLIFRLGVDPETAAPKLINPDEFSLLFEFGNQIPKGQKPFYWVDIAKKGKETTRYMVEGLRPLLFPEHFPGEF